MNIQPHNPDYQLISVIINGKELVFVQDNNGNNAGLEVYHLIDNNLSKGHYYSRRYAKNMVPMIYHELAIHLSNLLSYCPKGHKLSLEGDDYNELLTILKAA